jgi:ATP-dependent DNA helicase RecG
MHPSDPLSKHFRLVPSQVSALKKLAISTVEDLLRHIPARYDKAGGESAITGLISGTEATLFGTIDKLETRRSWKRRIPVGEARITDASGSIKVMWFHQPYLVKKFSEGMFVKAVGTVGGKDGKVYLANPHVEAADPADTKLFELTKSLQQKTENASPILFAVYPESRGVTSLWFRHAIERVMKADILSAIEDPIPEAVRERYNLPDVATALQWIHTPQQESHAQAARKRFAFEEIFAIQVARAKERAENDSQASFPIENAHDLAKKFLQSIDFAPTSAQERAIADILSDFNH